MIFWWPFHERMFPESWWAKHDKTTCRLAPANRRHRATVRRMRSTYLKLLPGHFSQISCWTLISKSKTKIYKAFKRDMTSKRNLWITWNHRELVKYSNSIKLEESKSSPRQIPSAWQVSFEFFQYILSPSAQSQTVYLGPNSKIAFFQFDLLVTFEVSNSPKFLIASFWNLLHQFTVGIKTCKPQTMFYWH